MRLENGAQLIKRAPCKSGRGFIVLAKRRDEYVTWWQLVPGPGGTLSGHYCATQKKAVKSFNKRTNKTETLDTLFSTPVI